MMNFPNDLVRDSSGKVVSATDWLGNKISIGDRVLYCISAGAGQQMAVGILLELRPVLKEEHSKFHVLGDSYAPKPANIYHHGHKLGEPKWSGFWKDGAHHPATWVVFDTYEYAQTKIRRIAASGWDGRDEKAARFVNEMNVTSLEGIKEACYKI